MDISDTLTAKSDQLNAEDLLNGPRIITVERVTRGSADQPVIVHFEGDGGKPWKPCKTARRILARAWGTNAGAWPGRRVEVYRDGDVTWSGKKVGGIRISRASHIDRRLTMALPLNKKAYRDYVIEPLPDESPPVPPLLDILAGANVTIEQADAWAEGKGKPALSGLSPDATATVAAWLWSDAGATALEDMRATVIPGSPGGEDRVTAMLAEYTPEQLADLYTTAYDEPPDGMTPREIATALIGDE